MNYTSSPQHQENLKQLVKTFLRVQIAFFAVGLAVADFITAVAVCPMYALQDIGYYLGVKNRDFSMFPLLQKAGQIGNTCLWLQ